MAININTTLTPQAGGTIPANSMLKPRLHFGNDILGRDENGNYDGTYKRVMTADLSFLYVSKAEYQANDSLYIGAIREFNSVFTKIMTEADYQALSANGLLAEQWIVEHLNSILGEGVCTLVDPYTV